MSVENNTRLKIRSLVEKGDYTKVKLSEKLGISRNHLHSLLEGDSKLYIEFIEKLCDIYDIPIYALFAEDADLSKKDNYNEIFKINDKDYAGQVENVLAGLKDLLLKAHE